MIFTGRLHTIMLHNKREFDGVLLKPVFFNRIMTHVSQNNIISHKIAQI